MKLKCCSYKEMLEDVQAKNKTIIMFGAGVIGQITTPSVLTELNILKNVNCYLDNDQRKWGRTIEVTGRQYKIYSPSYLQKCNENTVILINISRYAEVIEQLEKMECTKNMTAYIMPMMIIHNICSDSSGGNPVLLESPKIPKKINYMWLGKKQMPDRLKKCIETWHIYCPDYEIIEWNEDNYDVNKNLYMKQAYEVGAYGFVPDYARLDILYNEGGIYLDTDVELKKNLNPLLYQNVFCGVEKWQIINFGGCSGSVKGNINIKKFLEARQYISFINPDGSHNHNTCGYYDTQTAISLGYKLNGKTQCIDGMNFYAYDYFHPYDYMSGICNVTEHTYSIHQFNGGWMDEKMKEQNRQVSQNYLKLYKKCLKK